MKETVSNVCKVLALCSQKGGVGKTTSCVNLAVGLAREGKRVLVVDNDPQGSMTARLNHILLSIMTGKMWIRWMRGMHIVKSSVTISNTTFFVRVISRKV